MNIVIWIVFGALAGWIGSIVMGTNKQQGIFLNIVVGMAGALIGGFIMRLVGGSGVTGFNISSLLVAVLGSVILLAFVRLINRTA